MARDDYIEVGDRLQEFLSKYPEGSLQVVARELVELPANMGWWWIVEAHAYRTPDDPRPGIGLAQEAVPGRTSFTKGSELMNAETSAWGRAMAALGIATKKGIATGHEVRMAESRRSDDYGQTRPVQRVQQHADESDPYQEPLTQTEPPRVHRPDDAASQKQIGAIKGISAALGVGQIKAGDLARYVLKRDKDPNRPDSLVLTKGEASYVIEHLQGDHGKSIAAEFLGTLT